LALPEKQHGKGNRKADWYALLPCSNWNVKRPRAEKVVQKCELVVGIIYRATTLSPLFKKPDMDLLMWASSSISSKD